jgi:UPF0148 protein
MQQTVELIRRGAVMLKEPCQTCNGIQIRYHSKTYCTNHDDLSLILSAIEVTYADTTANLRQLLLVKLKEVMALLEKETDVTKQSEMTSLVLKYTELLNKLPES